MQAMIKLLGIVFLCALAKSAKSTRITLDEPVGDINSFTPGSNRNLFIVQAPSQHKIIIQIKELKLNSKSFLVLRDGPRGVQHKYTKYGNKIQESSGSSRKKILKLPFTVTAEQTSLYVYHKAINGAIGQGISAHYAVFTAEGKCEKASMDYDDVRNMTCDTDELDPYASQCNITITCRQNYKQYSNTLTCRSHMNIWEGVTCLPREDLLPICKYDFTEMMVVPGCPFTTEEILQYFLEVENLGLIQSGPDEIYLSRGSSAQKNLQKNCRDVCSFNRSRKRNKCDLTTRKGWTHCIVCRIKWKCRGFHSIIGK